MRPFPSEIYQPLRVVAKQFVVRLRQELLVPNKRGKARESIADPVFELGELTKLDRYTAERCEQDAEVARERA